MYTFIIYNLLTYYYNCTLRYNNEKYVVIMSWINQGDRVGSETSWTLIIVVEIC